MAELFAEVSGVRVIDGRITLPLVGAWHADVTLDKEATIAAKGLILTLGDLRLTCAPWRAPAPFQGRTRLRLIGGYGGWRKLLPAKGYKLASGVRLSLVLGDAARECGEALSLGEDRELGKHYTREEAPAHRHLNRLVGGAWWISPDGTTRTGAREATAIVSTFSLVGFDGAKGVATIATETPADFVPGRTFKTATLASTVMISGVVHTITKGAIRTEVLAA